MQNQKFNAATVEMKMARIYGKNHLSDKLGGTNGADWIYGYGYNDTLNGYSGSDRLYGGHGNDSLNGGYHNDSLYGGAQNDSLEGFSGADYLAGGAGSDWAIYDSSPEGVIVELGWGGRSVVTWGGHAQGDRLDSIENLLGSNRNDSFFGNDARNILDGGNGHDFLSGGGGDDWLRGGHGNDTFRGGAGDDSFSGGRGTDTIDFIEAPTGIIVRMDAHDDMTSGGNYGRPYADVGNDMDLLYSIENVLGSLHNDGINGTDGRNLLEGRAGRDVLKGEGGYDTLNGGAGDDILYGGAGNDTLNGGADDDTFFGGAGADTFVLTPGNRGNDIDRIADFERVTDQIVIHRAGTDIRNFTDIRDNTQELIGGNLRIDLDGDVLFLNDTDLSDLTYTDFTFV